MNKCTSQENILLSEAQLIKMWIHLKITSLGLGQAFNIFDWGILNELTIELFCGG